jgi:CheY-like chemotaxis protein
MQIKSAPPGKAAMASAKREVHILVVEDEVFIRMFISDAFRDEGYTVIEAFNADEAVDILKAGKAVDLVFSDVRMPGTLDGIGLLRFIKERFCTLPVILTSGHLDPSIALAEGAKHLLTKPYQIGTVLDLVASQLEKPTDDSIE